MSERLVIHILHSDDIIAPPSVTIVTSEQLSGSHIGFPPLQLPLAKQVPLLDPCNS